MTKLDSPLTRLVKARNERLRRPEPQQCVKVDTSAAKKEFNVSKPQYEFLNSSEYLSAMLGGIGSGKTFILCRWIRRKMRQEAGRGTIGGIFANTYQQLNQATLPELWSSFEEINMEYGRDYVFGEMPPKFWSGFRSKFGKKHTNVLSVREWGQAICRSLEQYENIRGIQLGWAGQDEARNAKKEAFDVVVGRLRCPLASQIQYRIVTSPNGYDWLYELMVEDVDKNPDLLSKRRLIHTKTTDNPALSADYIDTMLSLYDPRFAEQEIEGKFVLLTSGQVYHQFNRAIHCKPIKPSPALGYQVCFDFNRTPFSAIITQIATNKLTNQEIVFAIDEVVISDCGTTEMCKEIIKRLDSFGDKNGDIEIYGDASGRHKDTRNNINDYDIIEREFAKYGSRLKRQWRTRNPPVTARVNAVNAMMRNAKGDVRFYMSDKCSMLRKDFERVVWKAGTSDIDKTTDRTLTHTSDAIGYMIAERFPVLRPAAGRFSL